MAGAFFRDGFIGPIDLFTKSHCELLLKHYRQGIPPRPQAEWPKDLAVRDRLFYEVARRPALIALLRPILGEDIMLWGASVVERAPAQTHIWHTDIETSAPKGGFVTVWVGLENTCRDSTLQLISRSHRFGRPIQQEVHERGLRRGEATDDMVTAWAREHDCQSDLVQPDMNDGQALLFDGRLWHGSHNSGNQSRAALLLQYAAIGTPVLIPDFSRLEWPFRFTSVEPPGVVIAGNSKNGNMVPPPSACPSGAGPIRSQVHSGSKFEESPQGWIPYHLFHGPTPLLTEMEAHVSVLSPGCSPHPPHCHVQEEILIVLRGEAEILIGEGADPARVECLGSGSFVYYPAYQYHTIRNTSSSPVTYLMYKWQAALAEVNYPMQTKIFHANGVPQTSPFQPMSMGVLFEATTAYLDELQAHVTDLQLGAGYPAHIDEHDVAIIVFTGSVETLGQRLGPGGTVFYPAGEPHGMRNVGDEPARYLVFEFHRSKPLMATYAHPVTSVSTEHSKAKARQSITEHAILVFGHTRPQALQFVLEGLRRQDALAATQVWLDGHQEFPELVPFVRACQSLEAAYPEAQWYKYGSRCGFVKLFIDAVLLNCSRYKQLIILQDDCYPAPSAIEALLLSLKEIENNPHIFSVYGHHFGTPDEGTETSAFQCWGWASTSEKLRPIVTELSRLWNMPEPHALAWFNQNVTPAIRTRMDVFSGRSESNLLSGRFCFDAAMSFLIARNGMSNRKTPEHVIYNFGIGERCWHFPALVESYLKPPFNMIKRSDLIERFRLHGLADYEDVPSDGVVEVQEHRHDAEVKRLRIALATSEQDRADRLDVINRLNAALAISERDRADRLDVINRLNAAFITSEQDRADRLDLINRLNAALAISERDRAERLDVINRLNAAFITSEQDRADRLDLINRLNAAFTTSEKDRADRLDVINRLNAALTISEQDRADRLDVIKHLRARIDLLRAEIEARKHPWRIWASRAAALILVAKSLWSRLLAPVKR